MNSCETYQELISRLVDGEISHDEHEALMAHMKTCSRCNAMYAVFHDLSDILSEEPEELPAGLHENIMADVRRSDMRRRNRRMRTIGLRTALTAAACLVLVLFAASGFIPGRGAQNAAVSEREAATIPELAAAPAAVETAAPRVTAAPIPSAAPAALPETANASAQNIAPTTPDAYLAAEDSTEAQYSTPQPMQNIQQNIQYQPATPAPAYSEPPVYLEAPVYTQPPVYTQAPVYTPEPIYAPVYTPVTAEPETAPLPDLSASARRVSEAPAQAASLPADSAETPAAEDELNLFSLYMEDLDMFEAAAPDEEESTESEEAALSEELPEEDVQPDSAVFAEPEEAGDGEAEAEIPEAETPNAEKNETQRLSIRGKEARAKLLALLGGSEEKLPQEAELTRTVRLALVPEDEYGSEEKLDIRVYGDFIFYELHGADGSRSFRAACSLAELDAFLKNAESAPTPPPAPTQDPYAA